ncbi:hypothetical protein KCU91_g149, partial [Aureobasidium melanogenum]
MFLRSMIILRESSFQLKIFYRCCFTRSTAATCSSWVSRPSLDLCESFDDAFSLLDFSKMLVLLEHHARLLISGAQDLDPQFFASLPLGDHLHGAFFQILFAVFGVRHAQGFLLTPLLLFASVSFSLNNRSCSSSAARLRALSSWRWTSCSRAASSAARRLISACSAASAREEREFVVLRRRNIPG